MLPGPVLVAAGALLAAGAIAVGASAASEHGPGSPGVPRPTLPSAAIADRGDPAVQVVRYAPPATPLRVVRPFVPPSSPYGPGHRGVDLATRPGQVVRAAADGTVRFAGAVAGRGVVVVAHPDGISTEYEPVRPSVRAGTPVRLGTPIGRIAGAHGSCLPGRCLHWAARRDGSYFDPMTLLDPLGPVRLMPDAP